MTSATPDQRVLVFLTEERSRRRTTGGLVALYTDARFVDDFELLEDKIVDDAGRGVYRVVIQKRNQEEWEFVLAVHAELPRPSP